MRVNKQSPSGQGLTIKRGVCAVQGALFWMTVAIGAAMYAAPSAQAADGTAVSAQRINFDVPGGTLASVLSNFAADAGINISMSPELVKNRASQGLKGAYTVAAGLDVLLANSGLEAVSGSSNNWILRQQAATEDKSVLPTINVTGPQFEAVTDGTGSYTTRAVTIGKVARSLKETPQSVSVITRQQMEDRNLNLLNDVMDQATGVTRVNRNYGDNQFSIRGYLVQDANYMVDGVAGLVFSPNGWVPLDMAIYDRAEIIRGSAGTMIGAGDPSGAVNLVRKRPRAEKHFDVALSAGTWSNYRSEVDFGGAINEAGTVRGRAVVSYEDRKYFTDITHSTQPLFYGVIEADVSRSTTVFAGARYQKRMTDGYAIFGLPRYSNGQLIHVPRSTSLTQSWSRNDASVKEAFADVEHRFNEDWKAKLSYNHTEASFYQKVPIVRGPVNPVTGVGAGYFELTFRDQTVKSDAVDLNLAGAFNALGRKHEVLVGATWANRTSMIDGGSPRLSIPVDMFNPGATVFPEMPVPAITQRDRVKDTRYSYYANTRLELFQPLHLTLGARVNWYDYQVRSRITGQNTKVAKQNAKLVPYAALTYDLTPHWTTYVSYTESFLPQSELQSVSGKLLDPVVGKSYEAGIKGELMNGRLNTSFAVYQIVKNNIAVTDNDNAGKCPLSDVYGTCYINDSGAQKSTGFEAEVSGEVTSKWQIAAGYTYSKRKDKNGLTFSAETPRHMLRLSSNYKVTDKWTVGGGVSAQSGYVYETAGIPLRDGARAVWDMRSSYRITDNWTAAVSVANLSDKTYWISNGELRRGNYYGDPRSVTFTLRGHY